MAAAVTEESFQDCWFSEEHVMSESGIVMGKEVLCELILNKIRKIQKSKARADSNAVCKGLSKDHGLDEKTVLMCLDYMFLTKLIDKKFHRGKKSLRIKEKDTDTGNMDEYLEESSDAEKLERNGDNEENDEQSKGKARKISNDEERILELRSELTNTAEQQEKLMVDEDNRESLVQEDENTDHVQNTNGHNTPGRDNRSISISSDFSCDEVMEYTEAQWGGSKQGQEHVVKDTTSRRLDEMERKIDEIMSKINGAEQGRMRDDERKRSEEMLIRLGKLEEKNKQLKDENMALKLENFDLKQKAKYTQVPARVREDPWKFPNAVRPRSEKASAIKDHKTMENHGNSTTAIRENSENSEIPPGNIDSTDFTYADAVVHGQRSYARAQSTATSSAMHGEKETSLNRKEVGTEIGNCFGADRQFQHYQRNNYPANGQKPKFIIVGDSMTKKISRKEINDEARDYHVLVKSFPGATVEKMKYYLEPEIMSNPEGVIIHCGTNNLRNESPESVANKIVELAMEAKKRTQHVAVSSLVMRTDSNELDLKRARDSIDSNPISVKSPLGLENRQVPLESRGSPLFESVQEFSTNVSLESGVCNDIENNLDSTELLGQHSGEFSTSDTFPSPSLTASSQSDISDFPDDLQNLFGLRAQYHNHPIIGFLNINSIRYKITDLRIIIEKFLPDILVIQETKLSSEFNNNAFLINNYKTPMRQDRDEFGGGLMQYVRKGVVCNRVPSFEVSSLELICSELTVNKKKWIIYSIYRPPERSNLDSFFSALSLSLNSALDKYDNVILMGDININTFDKADAAYQKLASFCDRKKFPENLNF
eukprot:gene3824-4356_t